MFSGPEADRLAVRELVDSYSDAVMLRDAAPDGRNHAEAWAATWAEDGAWHVRGRCIQGRDAIVAAWIATMESFESVTFLAFPGAIEIDGDEGRVRTHTFEHLLPRGGQPRFQAGLYEDRVVRRDGRWLFAERRFHARELTL